MEPRIFHKTAELLKRAYAPFHKVDQVINWENCSLRSWLNNEFISTAFNNDEVAAIVSNNGEKVFLLTYDEAVHYCNNLGIIKGETTDYTSHKMYLKNDWWVKSIPYRKEARYVSFSGSQSMKHTISDSGIRPSIWIDLSNEIFSGNSYAIAKEMQDSAEKKMLITTRSTSD